MPTESNTVISPAVKAEIPEAQKAISKISWTQYLSVVQVIALSATAALPAFQQVVDGAPPFIPLWVTYVVATLSMLVAVAQGVFAHYGRANAIRAMNKAEQLSPEDKNYR